MRPKSKHGAKTERVNLCLRRADRQRLQKVAEREDRDMGYVCAWFVEFGLNLYEKWGLSLVDLSQMEIYNNKEIEKLALERLMLRHKAQVELENEKAQKRKVEESRRYEENEESSPERRTA